MGRITSNIGLITGLPIADTVNQLINISARPRDLLVQLNQKRDQRQLAISGLATQLLALQLSARKLQVTSFFDQRAVTSNNPTVLAAKADGTPDFGQYEFTPVAVARAQRLLSTGVASRTASLGAGTLSLRHGGFVDNNLSLGMLNGGEGVRSGLIRITDRTGASAQVDLRFAKNVGQVIEAINSVGLQVRAEVHGDRFRLIDLSGASVSNLRVDEVGGGTTAASLGLSGINAAVSQVDGSDVVRLFNEIDLDDLNDGNGVQFNSFLPDLRITFRDNSGPLDIDLARVGTPPTSITGTTGGVGRTDAQIIFTAKEARPELVGVQIRFLNDPAVARGNETVDYDSTQKTLTFRIDEGNTTANDVVSALSKDAVAGSLFSARVPSGSTGNGLVIEPDAVLIDGPRSTATTNAAGGVAAQLSITALVSDPALDGVSLVFQHSDSIAAGQEQVDTDLENKTITVTIHEGESTAANVVDALHADSAFAAKFSAASVAEGDGFVAATDTAETAGGTVIPTKHEQTLGELLATINLADPARLKAEISVDGDRIILTDLTQDQGGTFGITALNGSEVVKGLGLDSSAAGGVISGRRLLGGLASSLLATLNGGAGFGSLGEIQLTDRSQATATVDLNGAETLDEVIDRINAAGVGIQARVNAARNGIELVDTTGQAAGNLIVSDGDGTQSATKLQIVADVDATTINSGSLRRQIVSQNTFLSSLNGGAGVAKGTFKISDTTGLVRTFSLATDTIQTIGDLIREINGSGLHLLARINDRGDGIALVDTAYGENPLVIAEGNSKTAADLHLLRDATQVDIEGTPTLVIDGSTTTEITLSDIDTLDTLAAKINAANAGVTATVINDGSGSRPFRISLVSQRTGLAGALSIDASALGLRFDQTVAAQDALLAIGDVGTFGGGAIISSATNTFKQAVPGVSLEVLGTSETPVRVSVERNNTNVAAAIKDLVDRYNAIRSKIQELTSGGNAILQGSGSLLRVDSDLSNLFSRALNGVGSVRTVGSLGIRFYRPSIGTDGQLSETDLSQLGTLEFDPDQFAQAFAADPQGVSQFFSTKVLGMASRIDQAVNQLAGAEHSLLVNQIEAINRQISDDQRKIDLMNAKLDSERQRLTDSFIRAESIIAKLRDNLTVISNIAPLVFTRNTRSNSNNNS